MLELACRARAASRSRLSSSRRTTTNRLSRAATLYCSSPRARGEVLLYALLVALLLLSPLALAAEAAAPPAASADLGLREVHLRVLLLELAKHLRDDDDEFGRGDEVSKGRDVREEHDGRAGSGSSSARARRTSALRCSSDDGLPICCGKRRERNRCQLCKALEKSDLFMSRAVTEAERLAR